MALSFPLLLHPVETVDEQGNEFVYSAAAGGLVALSSLPAERRRDGIDSAVDSQQDRRINLEIQAQILVRRRQIRCGGSVDDTEGDTPEDASSASSSAASSLAHLADSDDRASTSTLPLNQVRAAAVHRAIVGVDAALQEVEALSRSDRHIATTASALPPGPPGALDLLFLADGSTRLALSETRRPPPHALAATAAATSALSGSAGPTLLLPAALRLKRKRQQLASAAGVLRSSAELLGCAAAAHQRTAQDLADLRQSWRVVAPSRDAALALGNRLLTRLDPLAVDCGLQTCGGPIDPLTTWVGLDANDASGGLVATPVPRHHSSSLVITIVDEGLDESLDKGGKCSMDSCHLSAALGPSLRSCGSKSSLPSSLSSLLLGVHDAALGRALMEEVRAAAIAGPDRRWLARGGTTSAAGGGGVSVLRATEACVEVEVRHGVTLRFEILSSAAAEAADAAAAATVPPSGDAPNGPLRGLARLLLCKGVEILLEKWQRPPGSAAAMAPKPPRPPSGRLGATGHDKTMEEIFGAKKQRPKHGAASPATLGSLGAPAGPAVSARAPPLDLLSELVHACRHALLLRDLRCVAAAGAWAVEGPLGGAQESLPACSRLLVRGAGGGAGGGAGDDWCVPVTVDGRRDLLVVDLASQCGGLGYGDYDFRRDLRGAAELAALCVAIGRRGAGGSLMIDPTRNGPWT